MLIANGVDGIEESNKLIEKFIKLKTRKLFKSQKSKSEKLAKFKNYQKVRIYLILTL